MEEDEEEKKEEEDWEGGDKGVEGGKISCSATPNSLTPVSLTIGQSVAFCVFI